MQLDSVAVFCGSRPGVRSHYARDAEVLAKLMAKEGIRLIYGGGRRGLMGLLAQTVKQHGGSVYAVTPKVIYQEYDHTFRPDEDHVVSNMHQRKAKMFRLSQGAIALPGGPGTLEEIMDYVVSTQLCIVTGNRRVFHHKPLCLVNTAGVYDNFIRFFHEDLSREGFHYERSDQLLLSADTPATALLALRQWYERNGARPKKKKKAA